MMGKVLDGRWVVKVSDTAAETSYTGCRTSQGQTTSGRVQKQQAGEPWSWDAYMEMLLQKEMEAEEDSEDQDESPPPAQLAEMGKPCRHQPVYTPTVSQKKTCSRYLTSSNRTVLVCPTTISLIVFRTCFITPRFPCSSHTANRPSRS